MLAFRRALVAFLLFGSIAFAAPAPVQEQSSTNSADAVARLSKQHKKSRSRTLNSDERLAILASALDSRTPRLSERDCSHLVHTIYERAGFPYAYADSDDLYEGIEDFQRVTHPEPGDLIVWHGHAGLVVRPSRHLFYSFLHAGPGVDDYTSHYWRGRGEPRFYRYIKSSACRGCTLAHSNRE
jgi:cell wall-associated NlpC family hydrolase